MAELKLLVPNKETETETEEVEVAEAEVEETTETDVEATETETEEVAEADEEESEPAETPRERALRKEVERLRRERREARELKQVTDEPKETVPVSSTEAVLYNSIQQDALDQFLEKHPEYNENEKLWGEFVKEFEDRVPLVEVARRTKVPLTRRLVLERLNSIHNVINVSGKELGKKELLKTQKLAKIASAGNTAGERAKQPTKPRRSIIPTKQSGLDSWLTKQK